MSTTGVPGRLGPRAPSVSIVICTRGRPRELDRCLEALARWTAGARAAAAVEVVVVDNAPVDEAAHDVARRRGARYLVEPRPGLSRARTRALRTCRSDILAYVDDDSVAEPGWLERMLEEFLAPNVGAVAGRTIPLRVESEAERLCEALKGGQSADKERRVIDRETDLWFERANFGGVGVGVGSNMAFRREALEHIGGFDSRLGRGMPLDVGEENYAFFLLVEKGWSVVYTPHAIVRHPYPSTLMALRERHLKDLAGAVAYMLFLFIEHPRYRWLVVKYAVEGTLGARRGWRRDRAAPRPRIVSAWRKWLALLTGPRLYYQSCGWPSRSGA